MISALFFLLIALVMLGIAYVIAPHLGNPSALKAKHIPYLHSYNETVVECDGGMFVSVCVPGDAINYRSESAQETAFERRVLIFNRVIPDSATVYYHRFRDEIVPLGPSAFTNDVSAAIDDEWRRLINDRGWSDSQFISIYMGFGMKRIAGDQEREYVSGKLQDAQRQLVSELASFGAKPVIYDNGRGHSPMLAFLHRMVNHEHLPVIEPVRNLSIKDWLSIPVTLFNKQRLTVANQAKNISAVIRLYEYSDFTAPQIMSEVEALPCSYALCQSFRRVDGSIYVEKLDIEIRRRESMEDKAVTTIEELKSVRDMVASNKVAVGEHQLTLTLTSTDPKRLKLAVTECLKAFKAYGIVAREELSLGIKLAYYSMLPGNTSYLTRRSDITSRNLASFLTFNATPVGKPRGHFLDYAETVLDSIDGTVRFVSMFDHDVGNTIIIGSNGTGKTVLTNFIASQMNRQGQRYYCIDLDQSSRIPIVAHGGQYLRVEKGEPFCNPLLMEPDAANLEFLKTLVGLMVQAPTAAEQNVISDTVENVMSLDRPLRTFTQIADIFKGMDVSDSSLYVRLRRFCRGGAYGHLFDNDVELSMRESTTYHGFDVTAALENEDITAPVVYTIFHFIERDTAAYDAPFTITIEEAWRALDTPETSEKIKKYEKTNRKQRGRLILITQDADDIQQCSIGKNIVNQTSTYFIYPGDSADETYRSIGLTDADIELLRRIPRRARRFLYKCGEVSIPLQFDYTGSRFMDTVLACSKERLKLFNEAKSINPTEWFPPYYKLVNGHDFH